MIQINRANAKMEILGIHRMRGTSGKLTSAASYMKQGRPRAHGSDLLTSPS